MDIFLDLVGELAEGRLASVAVGFAVPVAGAVAVGLIDFGIIIRACQDI